MDRDEFLALLNANHSFPMDYRVQIIVRQEEDLIADVLRALALQVGREHLDDRHQRVPSRSGTYVSLRVDLPVNAAVEVVEVYERLSKMEGLKSWF